MRHVCLSLLTCALLAAPAFANDGFAVRIGGAYAIVPNDQVALVTEDLRFTLHDYLVQVEVTSTYRNDGPAATVTMAFPQEVAWTDGLQNFRSWVDDQPVAVEFAFFSHWPDPEPAPKEADEDEYDDEDPDGVWVKSIPFAAGQTRTVRVTYDARMSGGQQEGTYVPYTLTTGAT